MGLIRKQLAALSKSDKERLRLMIDDHNARGGYFFSPDTMRFWGSEIAAGLFENNTFVTSEDDFNRTCKLFTARHYDWDTHSVKTIGEFQQFNTVVEAIAFAKSYKEETNHETATRNQNLEG